MTEDPAGLCPFRELGRNPGIDGALLPSAVFFLPAGWSSREELYPLIDVGDRVDME